MKKSIAITILVTCSCVLSLLLYAFYVPIIEKPEGVIYELSQGTSRKVFVAELAREGVIKHPMLFALYGYLQPHPYLKRGEYLFPYKATTFAIWKQVTQGSGFALHPFKIIPGWTFKQVKQSLSEATWVQHNVRDIDDKKLMAQLGNPDVDPEGEFFPDTYYYTKGVSDLVVLKHAMVMMLKKFGNAWENRAKDLPYQTAYEGLIAASIIEKEAYLDAERPVIAGVLVNRLRSGMLLQFDPTVIYGMGIRYNGKITKADLQTDTPYNTYTRKGLPPTPIAIPSMASIQAAMHPAQHDYLYFVAKGDGSHQFSKTLSEHNVAVSVAIKKK